MKILIADDQAIFSEMLERMLKPYGECVIVNDGSLAVQAFGAALEAGDPFDLVLLDIDMPCMDGQEALLQIRQMEKQKNRHSLTNDGLHAVIFMQTSMEDPSQLVTAYKIGRCNGYINKPVDEDDLLARLRKHNLL